MESKISEKEQKDKFPSKKSSKPIKQAALFQNLLLIVSIFLVLVTAILHLDLVPSVMLGCTLIGFNYFFTRKLVQKLLLEKKLQALDIIFIFTKFGISVIVLFGALNIFELSPNGLLIGISNVALATVIFTFFKVISPKKLF
tara:strand:- start:731 stop:1156 length:426 start_codon:yes stop_codon:yes gene_type:complete